MGSTVEIYPASFTDIKGITLPDGLTTLTPEMMFPDGKWLELHGRTMKVDGKIIGVFGVSPLWKGVGHTWAYVTLDAMPYRFSLLRTATALIKESRVKFGFWRLQSTVDARFDPGIRFLQHVGFVVDGLMPQYGPDRADHLMMSRILE